MAKNKEDNVLWQSLKMALLALIIGIILSISTESLINEQSGLLLVITVAISIVCLGVFFDMIGAAVLVAQEKPFHAMSSKKIGGAKQAIWLIRNAPNVATVCNDIVGDIAGTLGGVACATLSFLLADIYPPGHNIFKIGIPAIIAAATIGGKALMKTYGVEHWFVIVKNVGLLLFFIEQKLKINITSKPRKRRKRVS